MHIFALLVVFVLLMASLLDMGDAAAHRENRRKRKK